jgi:monoamine oxidase
MARTPLLGRLQQLYRDFFEHDATGRSLDEIATSRRQGPSRRDVLKLAVSGAVAAVAQPARLLATPPRIKIVGGGVAGLNAALTLQDAGLRSTVYEASPRLGGRMHSDTTSWLNDQVTERCGELIDTSHRTILGLAKRFKIGVADLLAAEPPHSTDTSYFSGQYYSENAAITDFDPVYRAVKRDAKAAGYPTLYTNYNGAGYVLDQMSVFDWIETRVPGGHSSRMGQLLDVAYNIEYGADTTDQSALNLIYLLAFQPTGSGFEVVGQSDERYHLAGGNEGLPRAMAAALPASSLELNAALNRIGLNPDGTFALRFRDKSSQFTVVADRVILAIPFSILRRLDYDQAGFNATKRAAIEQLGYGTNAKLNLQFNSRMWNSPGPWGLSTGGSFADTGYQSTWDVTRAQRGPTGILVNYTGGTVGASFRGDRTSSKVVAVYAKNFLNQIEPVFPGLTGEWNGRATLDTPATNPFLLGSYSYWRVGQYTQFSGVEKEPSGQCYFAGEHCSTDFQGFMEGAAQEGARAANEIISSV